MNTFGIALKPRTAVAQSWAAPNPDARHSEPYSISQEFATDTRHIPTHRAPGKAR